MCKMGILDISILLPSFHVAVTLDSKPDLADLLEEVGSEVLAEWQIFALQLGVHSSAIEGIERTEKGDSKTCIFKALAQWEKSPSPKRPYTWRTVVQVLRTQIIDRPDLASRIEEKYGGSN